MEDNNNIIKPVHVGLIMDGNGRWAEKRLMPRSAGHSAGMNRMIALARKAKELGIKYLTVYALSTENLSRPKEELDKLYGLISSYFTKNVQKLIKQGAAVKVIGDLSLLPEDIASVIKEGVAASPEKADFTFIIALAYGGRGEIVNAANKAVEKGLKLSEQNLSSMLYTAGIPDPDFIIRTGGELRLSNFLMWQAAYAELYFTDTLFPDFTNGKFEKALADFASRKRRFGKI
ncbi:MAG: polyprenyl diphosphate synthase [Candidatus Coproplasma sp.]